MGVVQRLGDVGDNADDPRRSEVCACQVIGGSALDVLHRNPQLAVLRLAAVEDGDDIGVVQRCRKVGFADESRPELVVQ